MCEEGRGRMEAGDYHNNPDKKNYRPLLHLWYWELRQDNASKKLEAKMIEGNWFGKGGSLKMTKQLNCKDLF